MTVRASGRNAELGAAMAEMLQMRMEMRGDSRQQQSRSSNTIRTKYLLSSKLLSKQYVWCQ